MTNKNNQLYQKYQMSDGETGDVGGLADALLSMSDEDRMKAYQVARLYASVSGDPKGFWK